MSTQAPYICLAIDWRDSDQFEDATHGQRLAWIELLCYARAEGRGQIERTVSWKPSKFARRYRVNPSAVKGMIERAVSDKAVRVEGDTLVILNWGRYQERGRKWSSRKDGKDKQDKKDRAPPTNQPDTETEISESALCVSRSSDRAEPDGFQSRLAGWLARIGRCQTPSEVLEAFGIVGRLRSRVLALDGLTVAEMHAAMSTVTAGVTRPELVMCKRLFDRRGIEMKTNGRISRDDMALAKALGDIRRSKGVQ